MNGPKDRTSHNTEDKSLALTHDATAQLTPNTCSEDVAVPAGITQQQPLALAFINGEAVITKPEDLYIPPDALKLILDTLLYHVIFA